MNNLLKAISLSHQHAGLSDREKVSLTEMECSSLLLKIKELLGVQEALVLSTCNRTEVYYLSEKDLSSTLISLIYAEKGGRADGGEEVPFRNLNSYQHALHHLFRVALGLDSQLLGDLQIIHQVKKASAGR